jgi:hypothetical protein
MNAKFSIEQTREQLRGTLGYSFLINSSLDEARAVSGVASSAHGFLIAAIKCYLVGMDH